MKRPTVVLLLALALGVGTGPIASPLLAAEGPSGHSHGEHAHGGDEAAASGEDPYTIHLETHPAPEKIIPDRDRVELMFEVRHAGGPARDVELSYRVYAPPRAFWFGTDFPVVEGTGLLSGTAHLPDGNQLISMILPIRGTYRVKTTARGPHGVSRRTMTFDVSENPQEVFNLSIFLIVLFLVGALAGYLSFRASSSPAPPTAALLAAFILGTLMLMSPDQARAHGEGSWDPHTLEGQKGVQTLDPSVKLDVRIFPQPVDVGEMLNVRYEVDAPSNGHASGHEAAGPEQHHPAHGHSEGNLVLAESHFVHSEGGLEMVKQTSWLEDGRGALNVQLFDGAPHYLVTRFYRPTDVYRPAGRHEHGHGKTEGSSGHEDEGDDHDSHGDDEHPEGDGSEHAHDAPEKEASHGTVEPSWEAEMQYHLEPGDYTVTFQTSGDPSMKWLLLPASRSRPRETAVDRMRDCQSVEPETIVSASGTCYNLTLNPEGTTHRFTLESGGDYHLFTQHLPREFDLTIKRNGDTVSPKRKFVTGKGEYLGRSVKWVEVNAIQPPLDDIVKSMLTLLGVVAFGFLVGYRGPRWVG